ncbi:MAG: putative aldehyde ferredoxin oxidoreductase, partial [Chloroflexi bacterium]|nr:putative aldehyde ferredoxin oxidoreductase [Chloroflexota bacterium]
TPNGVEYQQILGDMPNKYWTQATFEGAERISGARMAETILTGQTACQGCVIACGRVVTINEGPYATNGQAKGPEYETIAAFGSQLLVDDLPTITALSNHCDTVGIDTISAGNTIALAYLMFERGIITSEETGGLELRWGDAKPCFDLIEQIARREGFGALLAQGSKALAAHFHVEELAVHVNNLEVPMHDPRAMTGQALAYVTSPRGACHNQSDYFMVEMGNNSLVNCLFAATPPSTIVSLLSAATGHDWSLEEMLQAGERAWNLKRMFNCRLGLTRATEKLPKLLLEPLPDGGQAGHVPDMELMLHEYYAARGWDEVTGLPTPQKLAELGLNIQL